MKRKLFHGVGAMVLSLGLLASPAALARGHHHPKPIHGNTHKHKKHDNRLKPLGTEKRTGNKKGNAEKAAPERNIDDPPPQD